LVKSLSEAPQSDPLKRFIRTFPKTAAEADLLFFYPCKTFEIHVKNGTGYERRSNDNFSKDIVLDIFFTNFYQNLGHQSIDGVAAGFPCCHVQKKRAAIILSRGA
jgi:hypothetical protein